MSLKKNIACVLRWTLIAVHCLLAGLLVASAWGGLVHPEHGWVFPMLTLGLPFLLALALVDVVVMVLLRQWRWLVVMLAALVVAWPTARNITPLNVVSFKPKVDSTDNMQFTMLTYNVESFGRYDTTNHEPNASMRYILDTDADVVLVQEGSPERDYLLLTQLEKMMDEFNRKYPYHSDGNRDLLIFSKYPYTVGPDVEVRPVASSVNYVGGQYHYYAKTFDVELPQRRVRFVNVHLQSTGLNDMDKIRYIELLHGRLPRNDSTTAVTHSVFEKMSQAFKQRAVEARNVRRVVDDSRTDVIVCGDFNDTPGSYTYRTIKGDDMTDAWTECGLGPLHTFNNHHMYFKIDQVLYKGNLEAIAISCDKKGASDHYPLLTTFRLK